MRTNNPSLQSPTPSIRYTDVTVVPNKADGTPGNPAPSSRQTEHPLQPLSQQRKTAVGSHFTPPALHGANADAHARTRHASPHEQLEQRLQVLFGSRVEILSARPSREHSIPSLWIRDAGDIGVRLPGQNPRRMDNIDAAVAYLHKHGVPTDATLSAQRRAQSQALAHQVDERFNGLFSVAQEKPHRHDARAVIVWADPASGGLGVQIRRHPTPRSRPAGIRGAARARRRGVAPERR